MSNTERKDDKTIICTHSPTQTHKLGLKRIQNVDYLHFFYLASSYVKLTVKKPSTPKVNLIFFLLLSIFHVSQRDERYRLRSLNTFNVAFVFFSKKIKDDFEFEVPSYPSFFDEGGAEW